MFIDYNSAKEGVIVTVEMNLVLDPDTFELAYAHAKAQHGLELQKKTEDIAQTLTYIKEISTAFPPIQFDLLNSCFYNESEELIIWHSSKGKRSNADPENQKSSSESRRGCDCCHII